MLRIEMRSLSLCKPKSTAILIYIKISGTRSSNETDKRSNEDGKMYYDLYKKDMTHSIR